MMMLCIVKHLPNLVYFSKATPISHNVCSKFMFQSVFSCRRRSVFNLRLKESSYAMAENKHVTLGFACIRQSGGGVLAQQTKNNIQAVDSCSKHV